MVLIEMSDDEKPKDFMKQINDGVKDFVKNIFGDKGAEFMEDSGKKLNEFSVQAVKGIVDFNDKLIDSLKLNDNEMVKKGNEQVKDLLKQVGLLKEEEEDDF